MRITPQQSLPPVMESAELANNPDNSNNNNVLSQNIEQNNGLRVIPETKNQPNSVKEKKNSVIDKREPLFENHSGIPSILQREISRDAPKNDAHKKLPPSRCFIFQANKNTLVLANIKPVTFEMRNQKIKEKKETEEGDMSPGSKFKRKTPVRTFYSREAELFVRNHDEIQDVVEFLETNLAKYL